MSMYDEYESCITWKIENFSLWYRHADLRQLKTDFLEADILTKNKLNLRLKRCPSFVNNDVLRWGISYNEEGEVCIDYRMEMIDPNGRVLKSWEGQNEILAFTNTKIAWLCIFEVTKKEPDIQSWSEDVLTIRCHIRYADRKVQVASALCEARTRIGVDQNSFELELSESKIFEKRNIFRFDCGTKLAVEISKPESSALGDLIIHMKQIGVRDTVIRCETTLVDDDYNSISKNFTHCLPGYENSDWKLSPFITQYDHNHYRRIHFKFLVSNGIYTNKVSTTKSSDAKFITQPLKSKDTESTSQPKTNVQKSNVLTTLQKDLRDLFMNRKHTDVTLKAGGTTFPAHKLILKARSPVFEAMFDKDMIENQTDIVDVKDVEEKYLNSFLEYLYTETINKMDYECAKNLLLVSDKYQVQSLREKCSSQLIDELSIENVCEVCTIADMIADDELRKSAFDFMISHVEEVMQRPEWSHWSKSNSLLSIEVLSKIVLNLKKSSK